MATLFNIVSTDGDTASLSAVLGYSGQDNFIFTGSNHNPYLTMSFLGHNVNVASMGIDPLGGASGYVATLPSYTIAEAGFAIPNSGPLIIQDAAAAPAATDACVAGTEKKVGAYEYRCIASGNWGRLQYETGYTND